MLKRRRQIKNPYFLFRRSATGPYANRLRGKSTYGKGFGQRGSQVEGNIWTDDPDAVGAGWTDNGNGSYTAVNVESTGLQQNTTPGQLLDDGTYNISMQVSGLTSGFANVFLGGQTKFVSSSNIDSNGLFQQQVIIFSASSPISNAIFIDGSSSFTATISNIVILPAS